VGTIRRNWLLVTLRVTIRGGVPAGSRGPVPALGIYAAPRQDGQPKPADRPVHIIETARGLVAPDAGWTGGLPTGVRQLRMISSYLGRSENKGRKGASFRHYRHSM